jgi:D-serine deaminase-like pyridoxal phosphate-dependent protein
MTIDQRQAVLDAVPETPAVVVDVAVVRDNISRMAEAARNGGKALRPHAKTHKMLEVARMQLDAGAAGLQVAKLGEAEVFLGSGVTDVFIGYPVVGAGKVARLLDLAERVQVSVSLDALEVAEPIGRAARARGVTIPVLLELNTGLDRVGVLPDEEAVELALRIASLPGIAFLGVMTHEGQALSRSATHEQLEREALAACAQVVSIADAIRARGLECTRVSVGATATARFDVRAPGVTDVRPGTYVFNDATQVAQGAATLDQVAIWVVATVVSVHTDWIVVDAGSKSLSSDRLNRRDGPPIVGQLVDRPDYHVVRVSEEHGMISTPPDSPLRVGDRVAIVPSHACTVINLTDDVLVAEAGAIVDRWRVAARGRVQ